MRGGGELNQILSNPPFEVNYEELDREELIKLLKRRDKKIEKLKDKIQTHIEKEQLAIKSCERKREQLRQRESKTLLYEKILYKIVLDS